VSGGASRAGLHLRGPDGDPGGADPSPATGPAADPDTLARALATFVSTHIMARGRPIQPDDDLEAAGVDSMGLLKILLFIEAEFGFWMPDADLRAENVASLRALAGYVSRRSPA
jgi:acyl carrier protein